MRNAKRDLRNRMRATRSRLAAQERAAASEAIAQRVLRSPVFADAATILAYWPMPDEVDTRPIIRDALSLGKRIALPRCSPGAATFEAVDISAPPEDHLEPGPFPGLLQPRAGLPEHARDIPFDLAIVPGVAFDRKGGRLGFGAGMYDRFLSRHRVSFLLGVAFDIQIVSAVPTESHDRLMDVLVTETEYIEV